MLTRPLLIALLAFAANATHAQCIARHAATGKLVPVIETTGFTSSFRAFSTHRPDGYPIIYYGQGYMVLSPLMKQFVALHECAHLVESTSNEFLANCRALQIMREQGLSSYDEQLIAQSHYNDGPLPPQYGGSGAFFWSQTITCAGPRVL